MSARKMLIVTLTKTNGVLAVATRVGGAGLPAPADLVGDGLLARVQDDEGVVMIPTEELAVQEVDYNEEVIRTPLTHTVDPSGMVTVPAQGMKSVSPGASKVTVKVNPAPAPPTVPAGKAVVVVIDAGATLGPLKFFGSTAADTTDTDIPISGVPQGSHLVLASVDGYGALVSDISIT
jgi:hypothetical protein